MIRPPIRSVILVLTSLVAFGAKAQERTLHLFNWADYMSDEVLEQFERETGIKVVSDYFASNEEMIAKLQAGSFEYDIAVSSDYYVKILIHQGLIRRIDLSQIPNRKNLYEKFQNPAFDPNNTYSVPYFWGTTGIAYNKQKMTHKIDSWNALFDPRFRRKINLLDDMREVFAAALRLEGASANSRDPAEIAKARQKLIAQKELIRTYNSSMYREILGAGDVWISMGFSGDMAQLRRDNADIAFVNPKEGGTIFTDNLVMPKISKKPREAHLFINFILRPEIGAKLAEKVLFATPNREAHKRLPEHIRNDVAVYPPEATLSKMEYISDVGSALAVYEKHWIELKTY